MADGVYVLSCRLTFGLLWLRIFLNLLWFLSVLFGLFLLYWTFELPCPVKPPEFHDIPIKGCIRVLYLVFHPLGLGLDKVPFDWNSVSFQKIRVHFVYAVKHDGRFKARLVADGHLTKEPVESIYSGVVSLRSLKLNDLEIWGADVGNAYLEAYTDEKLCIIAGPEFKELQGHLLIMIKALYRTHSGGARWHDRLFDILQELNFKPSKADPDVWMRPEPGGTCYEYIAVYVDDLAIAAKDPQAFCNKLKKRYNLKLKGVGPLEYHLGCTYKRDPDGTLAADPRR